MSAKGTPYDNTVVESTNRLIKKELIYRNIYITGERLRREVNQNVWWYNKTRDYTRPSAA